jgi:transposase
MEKRIRSGYPSDISDEEWAFVAPYLALCREDAAQRDYPLRDVFNGLRYIAKTGNQWRFLPNDLPPWTVVYRQMRRWMDARCFEIMVEDLRILLREFAGRKSQPTAMISLTRFRARLSLTPSQVASNPLVCKTPRATLFAPNPPQAYNRVARHPIVSDDVYQFACWNPISINGRPFWA